MKKTRSKKSRDTVPLIMLAVWRNSLNILLCIVVFYYGASETINLSLKVEEIHQTFGVKMRQISLEIDQPLPCSDHCQTPLTNKKQRNLD
jgi:hypothetical protein